MAATPPPGITPAPTPAPQRGQRATFSARVDAFVTWLTAAVAQFVALATNVYDNAVAAFGSATASAQFANDAAQQAGYALTSAANAANSVTAAAAAISAPAWSSGATYQELAAATSRVNFKVYRKTTTAAVNTGGNADPANDPANWVAAGVPTLPKSTRTANVTLTVKDMATIVEIQSGAFTQTFDPAAVLGNGWYVWLRNAGTGDITLDPSGTESIDGLASFVMYPGEVRLIQSDGAALRSFVVTPFSKTYIATSVFVKPPGYSWFGGLAWSGGQSGGRSGTTNTQALGGYGGGCFPFTLPASSVGATEVVTIAAGGLPYTAVSAFAGNPGGNTSFGSIFTVFGATAGGGGAIGVTGATRGNGTGFDGGAASAGSFETIWGGSTGRNDGSQAAGKSLYGGAAGGSVNLGPAVMAFGTSIFGGNGGAGSSLGNGVDGVAPGGGGGATQTGTQSGAGARGELRIWGIV